MSRLPALYLGHGAPPLADDPTWPGELSAWAATLPRPEAVLMVSAHWEAAPPTVSASQRRLPLVYDFWGFPQRYYEVTYDAPPAPGLADRVCTLLGEAATGAGEPGSEHVVRRDETRGLDHGAYVPLVEMYPAADIPVLQLSLPTLDPLALFRMGRALAPLRDEGFLVIGSGFTTHNLRWFDPAGPADAPAPTPSQEFDAWADETVTTGDIDALLDWEHRAPAARTAHPRSEHWAPLYVALGAASSTPLGVPSGSASARAPAGVSTPVSGFWFGLSKRSWQFD